MFGKKRSSTTALASQNVTAAPSIYNENTVGSKVGVVTRNAARTALREISNQPVKASAKAAIKPTAVTETLIPRVVAAPKPAVSFAAPQVSVQAALKPATVVPPVAKAPIVQKAVEDDIDLDDLDDDSEEEESFDLEEEQDAIEEMEDNNSVDAMDIEDEDDAEIEIHEKYSRAQKMCTEIEDIDANDVEDPTFCTEYVEYIFDYLRQVEVNMRVDPNYIAKQAEVNERHRSILIDWIVEVSQKFKLLQETLFLAVNLIDRYLQVKAVTKSKLQLVGISALLIACKFEEICSPQVKDFVIISADAFTTDDVLTMERNMLAALGFNLNSATPLYFLRRFSKAGHANSEKHTIAKYLIELSLGEYKMLNYLPSEIAAAAVYIARRMKKTMPTWTPTLSYYSDYTEARLMNCVRDLNEIARKQQSGSSKLKAVYTKYQSQNLMCVANLPTVEI